MIKGLNKSGAYIYLCIPVLLTKVSSSEVKKNWNLFVLITKETSNYNKSSLIVNIKLLLGQTKPNN